MISVISTIMIFLGFINGYIVGFGIGLTKEHTLKQKLQKAIDNQFNSDKQIDYLKSEYNSLIEKYNGYEELINKINNDLLNIPIHLPPRNINFPPLPMSPLARCDSPCYEEDYTPNTPAISLDSMD